MPGDSVAPPQQLRRSYEAKLKEVRRREASPGAGAYPESADRERLFPDDPRLAQPVALRTYYDTLDATASGDLRLQRGPQPETLTKE